MACSTCATGGGCGGRNSGCNKKGGCASGGCNKMNVFDWLADMNLPSSEQFDIVEVRFKNGRKDFFRNSQKLDLCTGDMVLVEVPNGYHIGAVSLQGELVRLQMRKRGIKEDSEDIRNIIRIATEKDLEKHRQAQERNIPAMFRTRQIVQEMKIPMKLSDVEFQSDNTKATFYYSADDRVDFRELIKVLAAEFKIRVEMKQINLRQEAGRIGGIGTCGRELCCSTWLSDFKSVGTAAARYQNLSLNPTKLSGQCGRLKCCLNYELETYIDALREIPQIENNILLTKYGKAFLQKTDIFRKIMWFAYENETVWHPISAERVKEIIQLNNSGIIPESLETNLPKHHILDSEPEPKEEEIITNDTTSTSLKPNQPNSINQEAKKDKSENKKTVKKKNSNNKPKFKKKS
ncbi:MAG: Signal peptidase-like protein [Microscillaceae bacterium]|nr:Signal peptidase-like protein [Microscillaceae bacterium]MDW8460941.1 regulatory iron-sulfur-containing complex subunit RicT [Cytophagales bacterium]